MKLKPGMTANISITVDQRDGVLKIPNAGLRYAPPGVQRADLMAELGGEPMVMPQETASAVPPKLNSEFRQPQLAPGQKWDPSEKIRTASTREVVHRPGLVYVLNAEQKPEHRRVMLGITDGSTTEVVAGELKEGEPVIIGDSLQSAAPPASNGGPPLPLPGLRGLGGGRGRGN
jgi:HlyD family secretion protein